MKIVADEEFCRNFLEKSTGSNRTIFKNAIKSKNNEEFSLLMENFELKKENEMLKKKILEYESSNSWKITRPLRSIKK